MGPVRSFIARHLFAGGFAPQGRLGDLEKMYDELAKRDKLLLIGSEAANILLGSGYDDFDATVQKVLQHIGAPLEIDRLFIWKNLDAPEGLRYAMAYSWSLIPGDTQVVNEQESYSYAERLPRWHELFTKNEELNSLVSDLPPGERLWLEPMGIKAILALPLHYRGHFWGFASYDYSKSSRLFSEETVNILRSCSLMLINAIIYAELGQERAEALKQARYASKAKGDFLSNMSHEMRTPMNAIIGMTSIGLNATTTERKNYAFERIDMASKHLLGVINDILDMSKIEAGKFELTPTEFSLSKLLDRVMEVMNFRIEERHLKLSLKQAASIPPLLIGDDQRLMQVITNLLSNAIKFSHEGGSLFLEAKLLAQDGDAVEIIVSMHDTGIGISNEQLLRLFRSFEQAESSTSRKFGGTGLGLAISKSIVEMMGGTIWAESTPGVGSTFFFTVVLGLARGSEGFGDDLFFLPAEGLLPSAQKKEAADFSAYRILLAEDVEINQEIVKVLLEPTGVAIDVASDGRETVERLAKDPRYYDMVFMDVQMPECDGLEATRQIRALEDAWAREVPIVAMTANVFREDIEACLAAGMNDHVGKPLDLDDVMQKLKRYLLEKERA